VSNNLRLRIVGSSPAMPRPGSACSSYLLRTEDASLLVDIGSGAVGKLQLAVDYLELDAIVISHMHPDHFFDLVPLRYGVKARLRPVGRKLALWLPPGGSDRLRALSKVVSGHAGSEFFDDAFAVSEYDPARGLHVKDVRLDFCRTRHFVPAYAVRAVHDGARITYSADTAPSDTVVEHARDSAVFLCEAALGLGTEEGERGHTSAAEAGEMARRANAGRLVITHYPATDSPAALADAAKRSFEGPVEAAHDGLELEIV
jgi:ribonuclease BN (tRNA processing enzyme)